MAHPDGMPPYDICKREHANEWAVVDTVTGEIAREDGLLQAGLSFDQASATADRLNKSERQTPA